MSDNPLSCPKCHLSNLVKMPWEEWKCPSCGYSRWPTVKEKNFELPDPPSANMKISTSKPSISWVTKTTFIKDGILHFYSSSKKKISNKKNKRKPVKPIIKPPVIVQETGVSDKEQTVNITGKKKKKTKPDREAMDRFERERAESIVFQLLNDVEPKCGIMVSLKRVNLSEIRSNRFLKEIINSKDPVEIELIVKKLEAYLKMGSQPLWVRTTAILKIIEHPGVKQLIDQLKSHPDMDVRIIARR